MKSFGENEKSLLKKYYDACVAYFKHVSEKTYGAVVSAEHECRNAKISCGEINRIRMNAFAFVENENGTKFASANRVQCL